jgi:glutamyl-tRNA synthetase
VKSGARFDYDKAKWYNQQYIIKTANEVLAAMIRSEVSSFYSDEYLAKACGLMKERVETVGDISKVGNFLFGSPTEYDAKMILKKYKEVNDSHFMALTGALENLENFSAESTENTIKGYIEDNGLSFGAIMPVLRLATSGTMKGPDLFEMMELLGHDEVLVRMRDGLKEIKKIKSEVRS